MIRIFWPFGRPRFDDAVAFLERRPETSALVNASLTSPEVSWGFVTSHDDAGERRELELYVEQERVSIRFPITDPDDFHAALERGMAFLRGEDA